MDHAKLINASCHTYTISPFLANESLNTLWMNRVTHTNESCHTYTITTFLLYLLLHCQICVTSPIPNCDMTHSYLWQDARIWVTWRFHMYDTSYSYVGHEAFICVPWVIRVHSITTHYCTSLALQSTTTYSNTLQHSATTQCNTARHCKKL